MKKKRGTKEKPGESGGGSRRPRKKTHWPTKKGTSQNAVGKKTSAKEGGED